MPESSADRESSPTPSHPSPAQDQEDAVVDESTPFISPNNPPASPSSFPKTIRKVTASALTFSILSLVSLFATAVARQAGPVSFNLPWSTQEGLNGVVAPAIFSLLFSAYNLRRLRSNKAAAPLAINLVVDIVIAFFALTYGAGGLSGLLDGEGGWCSYPPEDDVFCRRGALPAKVFAGMAMGAGIVFGFMHFVLFCVRCRIAYRSGVGRFPWVLPVGQLEFRVSIKFLREAEREGEAREGTV